MREWTFTEKKLGVDCVLTIDDRAQIEVKVGDNKPIEVEEINWGKACFDGGQTLDVNGKELYKWGVSLGKYYDEIKAYYEVAEAEDKKKEKIEIEKAIEEIMKGERTLSIKQHYYYHTRKMACGMDRDIIEYLHCGSESFLGFLVDREFEDGDINKMLAHYEEVEKELRKKEEEEERKKKEKEKLLDGVQWDIKEYADRDEGGRTTSYKHIITVNGETFIFYERNVFDCGRVINPGYKITKSIDTGVAVFENGKWIWYDFTAGIGWEPVRELSGNEERAYEIVEKYGMYKNSDMRM